MSSDSVIEEDILEAIDTGSSGEDVRGIKYQGNDKAIHNNENSEQKTVSDQLNKHEENERKHKNTSENYREENGSHRVKQREAEGSEKNEVTHTRLDTDGLEETEKQQLNESGNDEAETLLETKPKHFINGLDNADKVNISIINYSSLLAESVLQEALLINEIYTRDSINLSLENKEAEERDKSIRKHLFPNENGRIPSNETGAGYDSYLIDKLLRSKADPAELEDTEGFDGNEDNFKRNKEETYPGLDCDDEYVKAELERVNTARELSDKNNNQMTPGLVDPFDENILETIHEDTELVIENGLHGTQESCVPEVAEAKIEKLSDTDYNAEDEMSSADNEEPADKKNAEFVDQVISNKPEIENIAADDEGVEKVPFVEEESESSEDEPDCCEMTFKQKQAVVKAVRKGDITLFEKLLEKKNADMGMNWYGENLLMVAIRSDQQEMAEFLIDNGIDWQQERKLVEVDKNGVISVHNITAREMAFDSNMDDLVELLDYKMNNLFPFVKPKPRDPRLRQPIAPFAPSPLDEGMREELMINPEEAKQWQKQVTQEYKQRQKEIELENLEMMQRRRKGLTSGHENESVHTAKSKRTCSDLNIIHDDISQVFGPDEGYGTMSPVSPYRHEFHVPDLKDNVSIRATRAFHLKKAFIASKTNHMKRTESPDYPMYQNNLIETVGSYNFESRRWHVPRSAPQFRNYSIESLQDPDVHVGLPFVHGAKRKVASSHSDRRNFSHGCSKSAHDNISPYSQVAKLLEESRLFSPVSRPSTSYLPSISNKKTKDLPLTKTRINYIYADRSSAKPKRSETSSIGPDLLPRRKLNCQLPSQG